MKISDIRIRLLSKNDAKFKAIASLTIDDCLVVHDIKVIEGKSGLFVSMPSRKTPDGEYKDIVHPTNNEMRNELKDKILEAYNKAKEENSDAE